jgi:hypothetical protein
MYQPIILFSLLPYLHAYLCDEFLCSKKHIFITLFHDVTNFTGWCAHFFEALPAGLIRGKAKLKPDPALLKHQPSGTSALVKCA